MMSKNVKFQNVTRKVIRTNNVLTTNITGEYVDVTGGILDAVKCNGCGKIHLIDETDGYARFITIYGNVLINDGGGVLGNNDWDKFSVPVYHYCPKCLIEDVGDWVK